jgi:hypothetical protein
MSMKRTGRVIVVVATLGTLPVAAFADEIIHFTNGAEMTVKSHSVEKEKEMVKVDLGGNSFISFPLTMVDKIVSAGQDVFLNPGFHPSNQAIAAGANVATADTSQHGIGESVPFHPRGLNGEKGTNLGETADHAPPTTVGGQPIDMPVAQARRIFNPAYPPPPGAAPQVIMPPGNKFRAPVQMQMLGAKPPETPSAPPPVEVQETAPANDPAPEDPPDAP